MLHQRRKRKFSRRIAHRMSMLRNLSKSLIEHERIQTTLPKAKSLRSVVEKLVTIGKDKSLHARRKLISKLGGDYKQIDKLLDVISPRFLDRKGGYTRILKSGSRLGDNAPMAYIEFVGDVKEVKQKEKIVNSSNDSPKSSKAAVAKTAPELSKPTKAKPTEAVVKKASKPSSKAEAPAETAKKTPKKVEK